VEHRNFLHRLRKSAAFAGLGLLLALGFVLFQGAPALAIDSVAKEALLVDEKTWTVMFEKNADDPVPPASMTKMMTAYLVFERLRDGRLSLDDTFTVSENAWRKGGAATGGSTMFLAPNTKVRVEDLIRGVVVQSGNDACIVIAEGLAGSEEAFAEEMNEQGKEIGLQQSTFKNATGWPAEGHLMSTRDIAWLAKRTINRFPEYYTYYSEKSFTYNNIRQGNRNPLLYENLGGDGLKTGHTKESGYGLAASAKQDGRRLILVLNGLPSKKERAREARRLMNWGFREFDNYTLFRANETVDEAKVWLGESATLPLATRQDVVVTLPRRARRGMRVTVSYKGPIAAPIKAGVEVASLLVSAPGVEPIEVPLVAATEVKRLGFFGRLGGMFQYLFWGAAG
jgi:D-alanyl-D-alanine carboxypeptidase (penicillin-binding protein 5/6)